MVDNAIKQLEEWVGNNYTELADWAKDARTLTEDFEKGYISEDEYKELMGDLKRSKKISEAADDLAVRSRAVELIDNIITSAGVVL